MMSSKRFYNVRYLNTDSQLVIYYLLRDAKTPRRTPRYLYMFWTLLVIIYIR